MCDMNVVGATERRDGKHDNTASVMKNAVLRTIKSILTEIPNQYPIPGVYVDLAKNEASYWLNGFFTSDGLKGIL